MNKELESIIKQFEKLMTQIHNCSASYNDYTTIFLGILIQIISSKQLFRKNVNVADFLEKNYGISYANYVKKSRPLLIGKTVKYFIDNDEQQDIKENLNLLYSFILRILEGKQDEVTWSDVIKNIDI